MGSKGDKTYTRVCDCYNTVFEGFNVPIGALYGRCLVPYFNGVDKVFWCCISPSDIKTDTLSVFIMKKTWSHNADCKISKTVWHEILVGENHPIYRAIYEKCHEIGGIPKIKTAKKQRTKTAITAKKQRTQAYYEKKARDLEYSQVASQFGLHKHPTPQARCYKQAQVDGKGYDISWEENVQPMKDADGYNYNGMPVQYENGKHLPPAAFTSFEGVTDTDLAKRRDGMKVNQTKCRPNKK